MVEKNRSVGLTPSTTDYFSFYYQGEFYKTISLPVWVNELDFENNTVKSYDFGQTIPRKDCEGKLGVVIDGTVEVLDSIKCTQLGVIAHRPTRVFTKGDTFGEFELLEESPKKDVIREPYYLAAGRICFLVAKKINRKDFESIYNCSGINFNIYKNYPSTKSDTRLPKTVISWISLKSITAGQKNIPRGLLQSAYDKIITYKLSINSYNLHLLLEFRDKCVLRIMNLDKKVKQSSRILAPLLDAIFDTLNRPLRGAPMYQFGWPKELADLNLPVVGYLGSKDSKDFLHATHSTIGIFYFPIDLSNYLINATVVGMYLDKDANLHGSLTTELRKQFPVKLKSRNINDSEDEAEFANNPPLKIIIDTVLDGVLAQYQNYPYRVTCEVYTGLNAVLHLLKFEKKCQF